MLRVSWIDTLNSFSAGPNQVGKRDVYFYITFTICIGHVPPEQSRHLYKCSSLRTFRSHFIVVFLQKYTSKQIWLTSQKTKKFDWQFKKNKRKRCQKPWTLRVQIPLKSKKVTKCLDWEKTYRTFLLRAIKAEVSVIPS